MKIRSGFVSNSSSSSFVCDVCGGDFSGMDASLSDFDLYECKDGHTYCSDHAEKTMADLGVKEKRAWLVETAWTEARKNELPNMDDDEIIELFDDNSYEMREAMPADFCPCCSLTSITHYQLVQYMLLRAKQSEEDVANEIRGKYKTYKDMLKDIECKQTI